MPRSRRALLKTAGITLGSGTLASAAGCLGVPSTGDDSAGDGSTGDDPSLPDSSSGASPTDLAQWFPDPTSTPLRDGYGVGYFDVAAIRDHQDAIHENAYARLESQMLYPVPDRYVDAADVDVAVQLDHIGQLVLGSFDPDAIAEQLTDRQSSSTASTTPTTPTRTPWSEPESYNGFDLYGTDYVYALSADAILHVSPMREGDAVEYAKAIIDAPAAETSQYSDGNEYVAAMFGTVDTPHALQCYPEAMDGSTSRGFRTDVITGGLKAWRFGTETTHLTLANTYPDAEAAESGELERYLDANSDRFEPYGGLEVTTEGRLAWTDGTIPTGEFDHLTAGGPGDGVHTPN